MPDDSYHITPQWKDLLVYDEGDGRRIEFDAGNMAEPYQVSVPAAGQWARRTPAWAHERRGIIIERLRKSGCIVEEVDNGVSTTLSPDGSFRVEVRQQDDYPAPPRRSIRIVLANGMEIVALDNCYPRGIMTFPSPGELILPVHLNGSTQQLGVNVVDRTFWTHPLEVQPLDSLPAWLASQQSVRPAVPWRSSPRRGRLWPILNLCGCLLFVAAGIWIVFAGSNSKDRWMGALAAVLFGLCALAPIRELRSREPRESTGRHD
jgi:hypothetical protein